MAHELDSRTCSSWERNGIMLAKDLGFVLKAEQRVAVGSRLVGNDVFAVLPTSFGKSLIFKLFVLATSRASSLLNAASSSPLI